MILKGSALLLADPTSALELANLMGKELGRPNLEEMICAELEREAMRLPPSRTNPFRYMLVDLAERRTPKPAGERRQMKRTVRQLRLTLELGAVTFQSQGAQQEEENAWAAPGGQPHGDGVGHLRGLQRRESLKLGPPRSPSHGDGASSAGEEEEGVESERPTARRRRRGESVSSDEVLDEEHSPGSPGRARDMWRLAAEVPPAVRDPRCEVKHFAWRFDAEPGVPDGRLRVHCTPPPGITRPLPRAHRHCRCSRGPACRSCPPDADGDRWPFAGSGISREAAAVVDRSMNVSKSLLGMALPKEELEDTQGRRRSSQFNVYANGESVEGGVAERITAKLLRADAAVKARCFKVNVVDVEEPSSSSSEADSQDSDDPPPRLGSQAISGMTVNRLRSLDACLMSPRPSPMCTMSSMMQRTTTAP